MNAAPQYVFASDHGVLAVAHQVIELIMKPTGFTILAGRGDSYERLGSRTASNMIPKEDVPDAYPRVYWV